MIYRAFIISSPKDYAMATLCAGRLAAQGWVARVLVCEAEWESVPEAAAVANYSTAGRGQFGKKCAVGISDGIIEHSSPGDIVAKFDCDVRLSDAVSDWLKCPAKARCLRLLRKRNEPWGGCWSATHEHLVNARKLMIDFADCNCAEAVLHLQALHRKEHGLLLHSTEFFHIYTGEVQDPSLSYTLPIAKDIRREESAGNLFGF